jgi:hypothetical protein
MRVVLELAERSTGEEARPGLEAFVRRVRGTDLQPSHSELPGIWTFTLPDGVELTEILEELRQLPDVRQADIDAMSGTS